MSTTEQEWQGPNPRPPGGIPDDTTLSNMSTMDLFQLIAENGLDGELDDGNEKLIKTLQKARA